MMKSNLLTKNEYVWKFTPHLSFDALIEDPLILGNSRAYSEQTFVQYSCVFGVFCRYIMERQISVLEITLQQIDDFLSVQSSSGSFSNVARHQYVKVINVAMKYLVKANLGTDNPLDVQYLCSEKLNQPEKIAETLTPLQDATLRQYLIKDFPARTWLERRNRAILIFALASGGSSGQIRDARCGQLRLSSVSISFHPMNRIENCEMSVILDGYAVAILREWLGEREFLKFSIESDVLFPNKDGRRLSITFVNCLVRALLGQVGFDCGLTGISLLRNTWYQRHLIEDGEREMMKRGYLRRRISHASREALREICTSYDLDSSNVDGRGTAAMNAFDRFELNSRKYTDEILNSDQDIGLQKYLLECLPTTTWRERRNRAMLLLALGAGASSALIQRATVDQFSFGKDRAEFRPGSLGSGLSLSLVLDDFAVEPIRRWMQERTSTYLLPVSKVAFPRSDGQPVSYLLVRSVARQILAKVDCGAKHKGISLLANTWYRRHLTDKRERTTGW